MPGYGWRGIPWKRVPEMVRSGSWVPVMRCEKSLELKLRDLRVAQAEPRAKRGRTSEQLVKGCPNRVAQHGWGKTACKRNEGRIYLRLFCVLECVSE